MILPSHPYRVFISFSHEDEDKLKAIESHLSSLDLEVRWSGIIPAGTAFAEQIKDGIASAHLFLPILTKSANERPWVHHEIGYAIGLNIPVLPIAVGELPRGMVEQLQALPLVDLEDLPHKLTLTLIEQHVLRSGNQGRAVFQHAEYPEDRTRLLVDSARKVFQLTGPVPIRQLGAFSSFSLPDAPPSDPLWSRCDGEGPPRSAALCRDLQQERRLLEEHAREAGCRLIVEPKPDYGPRGDGAKRARLQILVEFLEGMSDDRVTIVVTDSQQCGNVLMIGDWFLAESITPLPSRGYLQTLATCHAPTVLSRLREFDRTLDRLLAQKGLDPLSSRRAAIDRLHDEIDRLDSKSEPPKE